MASSFAGTVGDVGGMGSDIFESYCGAQVASIAAIAATLSTDILINVMAIVSLVLAPLLTRSRATRSLRPAKA